MDKDATILDRVVYFSEEMGFSLRSFSLSIGASPGYLHRLRSASSNIGGDFIEKIIKLYPELNPTWLVTGEEEMLKKEYSMNEPSSGYGSKDFFKQAILHYLDDEDVKDKVLELISAPNPNYYSSEEE